MIEKICPVDDLVEIDLSGYLAAQNKLREQMAQQFLDALNQGQLPWKACWQNGRPMNAVTGKLYRGVNALWLSYWAEDSGYLDPRWCTYKQAQEKGWQVQKGAKACRVEYWAYYDLKQKKLLSWSETQDLLKADPGYEKNLQLRSRVYCVFNAAQIDGIPDLQQNHTDIGPIRAQRDALIRNMDVGYEEHGSLAFYSPSTDTVTLPPEASFDDTYAYMCTFLHECGHASGAAHRLNRDLTGGFGSESYAREELRAEIASAFTAQALGIQLTDEQLKYHMEQHMAYIQSWAAVLKDAPEELFRAIKAAEGISDYLIEKGEFEQVINRDSIPAAEAPAQEPPKITQEDNNMEQAISEKSEWYVVQGAAGRLAVVPEAELQGREVLTTFQCSGVRDAVQQLHDYEAHQKYLRELADRGRYVDGKATSFLTPPSKILELAPKYPWASRDQLDEIAAGIQEGLAPELRSLYAKPVFSAIQMNAIRCALTSGLPLENVVVLVDPAFDSVQMDVIRAGFESGMTHEQVRSFAKPEIPAQQMLDAYWAIRDGRDWEPPQAASDGIDTPAPEPELDYCPEM